MLPDFRVRQRDYLLEISRALTEALDLATVLTRILQIHGRAAGGAGRAGGAARGRRPLANPRALRHP